MMHLCVKCMHCNIHEVGCVSTVNNTTYRCNNREYVSPVTGAMLLCVNVRNDEAACGREGRGYKEHS